MGQTYTNLLYHCVFSTKDRQPLITPDLGPNLHAYVGGIIRSLDGTAILINGVADHVHMLIALPATVAIAEAMRVVKANSSKWVHEDRRVPAFAWQHGYGAFTVSKSNVEAVSKYIAEQEEHHRKVTFQDEFVAFLKRHGVEYDERWIWK